MAQSSQVVWFPIFKARPECCDGIENQHRKDCVAGLSPDICSSEYGQVRQYWKDGGRSSGKTRVRWGLLLGQESPWETLDATGSQSEGESPTSIASSSLWKESAMGAMVDAVCGALGGAGHRRLSLFSAASQYEFAPVKSFFCRIRWVWRLVKARHGGWGSGFILHLFWFFCIQLDPGRSWKTRLGSC